MTKVKYWFLGSFIIAAMSLVLFQATTPAQAQELGVKDLVIGTGEAAAPGHLVLIHYTGRLANGDVFDSSLTRGRPFAFRLGKGQVIKGWEQGVKGMQVGGRRRLVIPPNLGYGGRAVGPIPANSTLTFDLELIGLEN